jgi:hypothetical protein
MSDMVVNICIYGAIKSSDSMSKLRYGNGVTIG